MFSSNAQHIVLLGALLAPINVASLAHAEFATGGSGAYRNNIVWFRWGADGVTIPQAGTTVTNSNSIDGQFLRVTCSLSNIAGSGADPDLIAYRPGNWRGDGLDDLYNIGGTGTANSLVVGLGNRVNGATVSANFSCSATFGPSNSAADPSFPLEGLVFADAEQSFSSQGEFVAATLTGGGTFRILETIRTSGCNVPGTATVSGSTLTLNGTSLCAMGPIAVGFLDGATSANFSMKGGGASAIALGVMVFVADGGDAPSSYGSPHHLPDFRFNGGAPTGTNWNYSTNPLAQLTRPALRIGASVDTETVDLSNPTASGDDATGSDDEDGFTRIPNIRIREGAPYQLNVPCFGGFGAVIYGYIDFNRDGDFLDANERSQPATCAASPAPVTWTMPDDANLVDGPSFLRLRIGNTDSQISSPTGVASGGEVEDYPVTLVAATITIQKQLASTGRRNANDQFMLSIAPSTGTAMTAITTGTENIITSPPVVQDPAGVGTVYTISETAAATTPPTIMDRYTTTYSCTNTRVGGQTPSGTGQSFTIIPAPNDELTCTFSNTWSPTADLVIGKTNAQPFSITAPFDLPDDALRRDVATSYTISVWNNGPDDVPNAVVRDTQMAGLTCAGPVTCSAIGDATCPAVGSVADLMGTGLTIPRLAASTTSPPQNYVTLQFTCPVD